MIYDELPITRLFALVGGIQAKSRRLAERALKPTGLTYSQYGVLVALGENDWVSQRAIGERLEADANTVAIIVDSLQGKGFVGRSGDPGDKRIWLVSLTESGREILGSANALIEPLYRGLAEGFTEAQLGPAADLLGRIYAILKSAEKERK